MGKIWHLISPISACPQTFFRKGGKAQAEEAPVPFNSLYGAVRSAVNRLESGKVCYDVIEMENPLL